ncbi:MAG: RIP metalloprotease [Actinomycetota bacterium]|nr:RIP metalloprotease [Actinomycetota bacterium]
MATWIGSVLFVIAVTIAIGLHEWGHFVTARWFGMRAERFFIGFGPTLWSTRRGETEYGVKWFPLGGFVRIAGMSIGESRQRPIAEAVFDGDAIAADRRATAETERRPLDEVEAVPAATWERLDEELAQRGVPPAEREALVTDTRRQVGSDASAAEAARAFTAIAATRLEDTGRVGDLRHRVLSGDDGRFFHDRPAWQRAVVLAAGSTMHFLQAIVLLLVAFWAFGIQPVPVVRQVLPDSPAAAAGLQADDRIVAVNGHPVQTFPDAKRRIEAHAGEPITLAVERRDGTRRQLTLTTALVVGQLPPGSVLADAGLQPGDRIISVAGEEVSGRSDIAPAGVRGTVDVTVQRLGDEPGDVREVTLTVPAGALDELAQLVSGLAGFVPAHQDLGAVGALRETFVGEGSFPALFVGTIRALGGVFGPEGIGAIFRQLGGAERGLEGGASLVGITMIAGEGTAVAGAFFLLGLLASLNVFIGVFNLIPLPPLDGGHLAVLAVERGVNAVRGVRGLPADYRVDPRTVTAIAIPVIVLVGMVALALIVLDITNPLRLPD